MSDIRAIAEAIETRRESTVTSGKILTFTAAGENF
jgi:hypothetical protein